MENKRHWYDGWLFAKLIDENSIKVRSKISQVIPKGSSVLDVACGTGALVKHLSKKCKRVVGVELSKKMINYARRNNNCSNVEYHHWSGTELSRKFSEEFDYAVIKLALHEMPHADRVKTLKEMKKVSDKIVIVDFNTPLPNNIHKIGIKIVELIAGIEHYRKHQSFMRNDGINGLVKETRLRVLSGEVFDKGCSRMVVVE